jgi:hypothetical protein
MPSHDVPDHPLALILAEAFAAQLESGEVDLMELRDSQEFEIQADDWTLHLAGWPVTVAFIALDEEPHSLAERQIALDAALDTQHMAGLRHANLLLDDAIVAALVDSGDELSALLASALTISGNNDLLDELEV